MSGRHLHIVAYDVASPRRLRHVLTAVKGFSTGGQKSVHECFMSAAEKTELLRMIEKAISAVDDSVVIIRLDPKPAVRTLGIARPPRDEAFFYVG